MAKKLKKKGFKRFFLGLGIYAVVFLALAFFGLSAFWDFIEAYEISRPKNTIAQHVEQLTLEQIASGDTALLSQIDLKIQNEEAFRKVITDSLTQDITYAQNVAETTDTKLVYMLMCGSKAIGKVTLSPEAPDQYGFTPWKVSGQSFDFSYLLGSSATITVPHDFTVHANGVKLDSSYITQENIPYEALKSYYGDYQPPYMVTYTVDPVLGDIQLEAHDRNGTVVTVDENTDLTVYMNNCSDPELKATNDLLEPFLRSYVAFTSNYGGKENTKNNYDTLLEYLVPGGDMAKRMYQALDGLGWAKNTRSTITDIQRNHTVNLGGGRYLCDVTYTVEAALYWEDPISVNNVKIIMVETGSGLRVESLMVY